MGSRRCCCILVVVAGGRRPAARGAGRTASSSLILVTGVGVPRPAPSVAGACVLRRSGRSRLLKLPKGNPYAWAFSATSTTTCCVRGRWPSYARPRGKSTLPPPFGSVYADRRWACPDGAATRVIVRLAGRACRLHRRLNEARPHWAAPGAAVPAASTYLPAPMTNTTLTPLRILAALVLAAAFGGFAA